MRRKDTRRNDRKRGKVHCLASVHDGAKCNAQSTANTRPSARPAEVLAGPPPQEPSDGELFEYLTAAVGARDVLSIRA